MSVSYCQSYYDFGTWQWSWSWGWDMGENRLTCKHYLSSVQVMRLQAIFIFFLLVLILLIFYNEYYLNILKVI